MSEKKLMLVSLGCAKNTVDSETALGEIVNAGYALAIEPEDADVILINTCGFIGAAREEAYSVIEEMLSYKNKRGWPKVVAMGCLAQRWGAKIRHDFPDIDAVLGLAAYGKLEKYLNSVFKDKKIVDGLSKNRKVAEGERLLSTPQSYAYLRIADGCENYCSYCSIPLIRGRVRSRELESVVDEAVVLAEAGIPELVLVAQDTTVYGQDIYGQPAFEKLLEGILEQTDVPRIRVLYAHPAHINEELFKMFGQEPRLCSYLDLPLQHINSRVLDQMNRHYTRADVEKLLEYKAKHCPDLVLRTSLIAGFPGESDEEFAELLKFVEEGHFNYMGAFPYSPEDDTPAAGYDRQIPEKQAAERLDELMLAQQKVTFDWIDSRIGQNVEVVIDEFTPEGYAICRSVAEAPEADGLIYVGIEENEVPDKIDIGSQIIACLEKRNGYDIEATIV